MSTPTVASSIVYAESGRPGDASWLTGRDRAVLLAVAAGRGRITTDCFPSLLIDHHHCCDQSGTADLLAAGLIGPALSRPEAPYGVDRLVPSTDLSVEAQLTPAGRTALVTQIKPPGRRHVAGENRSIHKAHAGRRTPGVP